MAVAMKSVRSISPFCKIWDCEQVPSVTLRLPTPVIEPQHRCARPALEFLAPNASSVEIDQWLPIARITALQSVTKSREIIRNFRRLMKRIEPSVTNQPEHKTVVDRT